MTFLRRPWSRVTDTATCALLNLAQWRHGHEATTRENLGVYLDACAPLDRQAFYSSPPLEPVEASDTMLVWPTPHPSGRAENDRAAAWLQLCPGGYAAPTVLILHALMSVDDTGYRRLAAEFNALGWNAAFLYLPFHYTRRPRGYLNGELAITADLIRNGQGLRQAVSELRQLMSWLSARGCREFGLYGTSYGAWAGALLASLEDDISFIALLQPITYT